MHERVGRAGIRDGWWVMRQREKWVRVIVWVTVVGMVLTLFAGVFAILNA